MFESLSRIQEVITIRKLFIILLSLVVITSLSISTFASYTTPSGTSYGYFDSELGFHQLSYWSAVTEALKGLATNIYNISSRVLSIKTNTDTIRTNSNSIKTNTDNIKSNTDSIKTSSSSIDDKMPSGYYAWVTNAGEGTAQANSTFTYWRATATSLTHMGIDIDDINEKMPDGFYAWMGATSATSASNSSRTYWSAISGSLAYMGQDIEQMKNDIIDLHYMFASPEDLALKADQENNITSATTNFLSGSDSATSVGTQSIGKVKDLGDDVSSFFSTGVQATSLFDSLSDTSSDGPWLWFTSAVKDNLTGSQSRSNSKSSNLPGEQVVDYYSDKMAELDKLLGEVSEDD